MLKSKAVEDSDNFKEKSENQNGGEMRLPTDSIDPEYTKKTDPGSCRIYKKRKTLPVESSEKIEQNLADLQKERVETVRCESTPSIEQVSISANQNSCNLSENPSNTRNSTSVKSLGSTELMGPKRDASSISDVTQLNLSKANQPTAGDLEVLQCHSCEKSFNRNGSSQHSTQPCSSVLYKCNDCEKSSQSSVLNALSSIRSKPKKNECNICLKTFKIPSRLLFHMRSHRKPYHCDVCGMDFKNAPELKNHLSNHFT